MRVPIVALLLAAAASADDIYAKSGDKPIAGDVKVLSEGEKIVYVDKSLKERSFSRDMVGRVEKHHSDVHDCLDRLDAAKDACRDILLDGPEQDRYAALADLCERLGRPFEAQC